MNDILKYIVVKNGHGIVSHSVELPRKSVELYQIVVTIALVYSSYFVFRMKLGLKVQDILCLFMVFLVSSIVYVWYLNQAYRGK